jgi:MerR family copper efflux transcriptional regulator
MTGALKIGELASAVGVSTDTVRYYERLKLVHRAGRTQSGYRMYTDEDVKRLRFIKQAQKFGFSLDEIKKILPVKESGLDECQHVRDLLGSKLEELDARLAELSDFRRTLAVYFKECERTLAGQRGDCCPVLFEISSPSGVAPVPACPPVKLSPMERKARRGER